MATVRFTADIRSDGTIQPPEGIHLVPGKAQVTVEHAEGSGDDTRSPAEAPGVPPVARDLAKLAAGIDPTDLPSDLAQNHDQYAHGSEKGIDQS